MKNTVNGEAIVEPRMLNPYMDMPIVSPNSSRSHRNCDTPLIRIADITQDKLTLEAIKCARILIVIYDGSQLL